MEKAIDINYLQLFSGYSLMLIPLVILWHYKTGLVKDSIIAVVRMTIQLLLVGVYLEYIFKLNSALVNVTWVLCMSIIASFTTLRRSGLRYKAFFLPIFLSSVISIAVADTFFLGLVIRLNNIFDARFFIPITGMLIGSSLRNVIMSLDAYYKRIDDEQSLYRWHLANGASHKEALQPFMRQALRRAFNPMIANTATMGLISLPGMMTGQILGGSDPSIAIKYQIMLMMSIFTTAVLNVTLTINLSNRMAFDKYHNLNKNIFRKQS